MIATYCVPDSLWDTFTYLCLFAPHKLVTDEETEVQRGSQLILSLLLNPGRLAPLPDQLLPGQRLTLPSLRSFGGHRLI